MPAINQWLLNEFVPALSRTLLHSLWQGLLIAIIAAIVLLCTKKLKAPVRYNSLLVILCGALATFVFTFLHELGKAANPTFSNHIMPSSVPPGEAAYQPQITSMPSDEGNIYSTLLAYLDRYAIILVSVWAFFFLLHLSRMATGLFYIQNLQQQKKKTASAEWNEWLRKQSTNWGMTKPVALVESAIIHVPAAIGFFKPVILVPAGLLTGLPASQVEAILLHELAHIKRKDYLVNLFQSIVDAIFFFNPAILWLSSLIRRERENCCDEMVLQTSANPQEYVQALLSFQEYQIPSAYAMALDNGKGMLLKRVRRILLQENNSISKKEASGLVAATIVLCIGLFAFRSKDEGRIISGVDVIKEDPIPMHEIDLSTVSPLTFVSAHSMWQDTVPAPAKKLSVEKKKIKKVIRNRVDDGKNKKEQVIVTDEEGKQYRIRKEGNRVQKSEINKQEIPKENQKRFEKPLEELGRRKEAQLNKLQETNLRRQKSLLEKQAFLNKKLTEVNRNQDQTKKEFLNRQLSLQMNKKMELNKEKFEIQQKKFNLQNNKNFSIKPQKGFKGFSPMKTGMNPTLASILQDLKASQMITDDSKFSFTLKDGALIVNGKTQPEEIYEVYRKKYLKSSGDSFSYLKDGGTTKTEVNIQ